MDTKNTELESRLKNELKMASLHSEILSKEIKIVIMKLIAKIIITKQLMIK